MMILPLSSVTTAYDIFDEIQQKTILDGSAPLYHLALSLGCIFCCMHFVTLSTKVFRGSNQWRPWDIVKPLVLLLLIQNFNLVVGAVDGTIGVVCKGIAGYTADQMDWDIIDGFSTTYDKWITAADVKEDDLLADAETSADEDSNGGLFGGMINVRKWLEEAEEWAFEKIKAFVGITQSSFQWILAQCIATLAEWIGFIILIFAKIYLLVLTFIGPFVFSLSIIPTFQNGVGQWAARYIQISFWYPILQVINLVYMKFVVHIPDMIAQADTLDALFAQSQFASLIFLLASIAVIFMYFSVPKVAAWLIQSTGANNAHNNASRAASTTVATVAKTVI